MFVVNLSEEQVNNLFKCLDVTLKSGGLQSLAMVTDLHNALAAAVAKPAPGGKQYDGKKKKKEPEADA